RIANELADSIHLPAPVRLIEQGNDGVRVKTDDGTFYEANRVIVAIPPTLLSRIIYRPVLPAYRTQLIQRAPAGSVIKCMAIYESPFWREDGLTGQVICNEGPVRVTYDNSPPDGNPGVLLAFIEGDEARSLSRATPMKRRQVVLDALLNFFDRRAAHPIDYFDKDWSADEWTGGCYGAHFPTGVWTSFGPVLREPIGRIHWAGTETATEWNGYIEGAVQSAERVVDEILGANRVI
ncbi:MAG TPA: FAD-dependent oxidoreductase, partial [Aggregatilineales bacterium]|nr:FAD-dependent oxidoreductase [Aggregatilineales bacterium]